MSDRLATVFRNNVRVRMQQLGVSQRELAEKIGVTAAHVNHLLSGYRNPGLETLESFADALATTPAKLLIEKKLSKSA